MQSGKPQLAVRALQGVIAHAERSLPTVVIYAQALAMLNQHERAARYYGLAVKLQPQNARLRTELALSLKHTGDPRAALDQIQQARKSEPWYPKSAMVEAEILIDLDRADEALDALDSFEREAPAEAKSAPSTAMLLITKSRLAPKYVAPDAILGELQKLAADSAVHPKQRSLLLARAGEMLDKLGRFDEAMDTIVESKKMRGLPWDAQAHTGRVRACVSAWTSDRAKELPASGVDGSPMVFILGMPRSGSSLLEQMLARHPAIQALGERNDVNFAAAAIQPPALGEKPMVTDVTMLTEEKCERCAQGIDKTIRSLRNSGTRFTLDKQPFNFVHVPLLARLLPGCRVLHTVRDPRDVAVSYCMQWFMEDHGQANSMETLGQYYRDYWSMMNEWERLSSPNQRPEMMQVRYERVVSDPEEVMREVLGFLGLEFDSSVLDHTQTDRTIVTASRDQVKEGLYTTSVNRWKRYEKHLAPFVEHVREFLED
ncbi:MAG: hypothetical protein Phyf2KO_23870 [Phycisphaerales bacterium]